MRFGLVVLLGVFVFYTKAQSPIIYKDQRSSVEQRANDLLSRLTLEEKISLLGYSSDAVPRLNIPAYNWWNEALHGVARAGKATVFPQAIAMAASFNDSLIMEVGSAISTEARAKYNLSIARGKSQQYMGLTFWSPNINIFRDPRWGRGQETYGEDPYLTGTMGAAFVRGLQGNNRDVLKTSACAKHFAVHSGPEAGRHSFNALVDEKDLRETYLYAFKKLVDGGVESVMCAYNRVNGEPCCTGNFLMQKILREEWKFKGHVVTDCWALDDVFLRHQSLPDNYATAAAAIKAGVNLDCSNLLKTDVLNVIKKGLLTEADIDKALLPLLQTQVKLGFYNDSKDQKWSGFGEDSVANEYHRSLARKMAQQSMVLLKNDRNVLPLNASKLGSVMVVGPNAASLDALVANYHGVSGKAVNFVEGITAAVGAGTRVEYDQGCDFTDTVHFGGTWASGNADVTVAVIGLTPVYEGEEGDAFLSPGGGDKVSLSPPAAHIAYIKALRKASNKPLIVVVTGGSAVDISAISPFCDAVIFAWYPGEEGGNALADILFGKVSPSGRLPITFYSSLTDLPEYSNYSMKGRTYRYFDGKVQFPFGYGLSYTDFEYETLRSVKMVLTERDTIDLTIKVKNIGDHDGDEVVQLYIDYPDGERMPLKELKAFQRLSVPKNSAGVVNFKVPVNELKKWDLKEGSWKLYKGEYKIRVGGSSNNSKLVFTRPVG